jgi:CheY-like chemotaxis protein
MAGWESVAMRIGSILVGASCQPIGGRRATKGHLMGVALASEPLSILMVEDNPADADLVCEMLREASSAAGATPEIHHVETLRGALAAARQHFDVALLDLGLPDASGLEGLGALAASVPDLPAVVLTSARDPALAAKALGAGAQDYLVKGEVQSDLLLRSLCFAVARQRYAARRLEIVAEHETNGHGEGADHARPAGVPGDVAEARAGRRAALHDAAVRRVLLVEDNSGDAELVRLALAEGSSEFAVHHVERLGDALSHLSSGDVDVVLLDLGLPDAAGMECVEKVRAAFPDLPIVVLSGSFVGLEVVRSGVQDYVRKDELEPHALQRAIDYAIVRNAHGRRARELAAERAAHAATQAVAKALEEANRRLAIATREAREALEREAAARAAAEHRQQQVEALFESMIDPVLVYGEDRRIESTNPAGARFFEAEVRGLTPAGFIDTADIRSSDGARMTVESLPATRALEGAIVAGERIRVRTPGGEILAGCDAPGAPAWHSPGHHSRSRARALRVRFLLTRDRPRKDPVSAANVLQSSVSSFPQLSPEPGPSHLPIAVDSAARDLQNFGCFLLRETAEIPQLHYPALPGTPFRQARQGFIQREQSFIVLNDSRQVLAKLHRGSSSTFLGDARPCVVNQDVSHGLRGDSQEVGAAAPVAIPLSGQS